MWSLPPGFDCADSLLPEVRNNPPEPQPEPVVVTELPLPPTAPSDQNGSCSLEINARGTGCIDASDRAIEEGPAYMWDGHHVLLTINFTGAPAAPDKRSIFSGAQVIIIKTDGKKFPNGDSWRCITCGIPEENKIGWNKPDQSRMGSNSNLDHPQPFHDGKRILAGNNIIESPVPFTSNKFDPKNVKIFPIRWNVNEDGSGPGGSMRELRLHPDHVHLGWSHIEFSRGIGQYPCFGKLVFNPDPAEGAPLTPRYELTNVNILLNTSPEYQFFRLDPEHAGALLHNDPRGVIGEFRGWTADGKSTLGIYVEESGNWDGYATSLATGESRRITRNPAYTDPMKSSPDDNWTIVMDARDDNRSMWAAGMRGIPPLTDMLTVLVVTGSRNNGNRRFFQPYLIDRYGDRGTYQGQQLNAGDGKPGSISDPNWNGRADPAWSPDGTKVVYWQALVTTPSCGGNNPLPCPVSAEPGGRHTRLMIADLISRKPQKIRTVKPVPDRVPWGVPYEPGKDFSSMPDQIPPGKYILRGKTSGLADIEIRGGKGGRSLGYISVTYEDFTDDGLHIINGTESVEAVGTGMMGTLVWHSDLKSSGCQSATKVTSEPEGFVVKGFMGDQRAGKMTTTINGKSYSSPETGQ